MITICKENNLKMEVNLQSLKSLSDFYSFLGIIEEKKEYL